MQRQQLETKTASVLERIGLEDEKAVTLALEAGIKKRKRAVQ
jgi:hypothetical protein